MRKILICEPCGSEISNISIIVKNLAYRKDLMISPDCVNNLVEYDREYFSGNVSELIYNCDKCGGVIITLKDSYYLNDFVKDGYIQLSKLRYGNLVVKEIQTYCDKDTTL